ncbi:MAG: hypothetical protein Q7V05_08535 [Methanoregula sp.]|nr:hypothetical protein [Methanoregula sp.]
MITVNLKKGVFYPEYFKNTVFGLTPSREILAFTVLSIVENGEPWEEARSENTVLEGLWRMNENGA